CRKPTGFGRFLCYLVWSLSDHATYFAGCCTTNGRESKNHQGRRGQKSCSRQQLSSERCTHLDFVSERKNFMEAVRCCFNFPTPSSYTSSNCLKSFCFGNISWSK